MTQGMAMFDAIENDQILSFSTLQTSLKLVIKCDVKF